MPNMSYCRFQNTFRDLQDCFDSIDDNLSEEEHEARKNLIELCQSIVRECFDEEGEPVGEWSEDYKEKEDDEE